MADITQSEREQCWPNGSGTEDFVVVKITPHQVELSEMFAMNNKRVWRV